MKKNIFTIGLCTAALLLAGVSCSKDNEVEELMNGDSSITTKAVVIRDSLTVETDTVGTLREKIGDRASSLQKLIVSGPIDATDVNTIRNMENLLALDLKGATICGGDSTYTSTYTSGNDQYRLYDNVIGQYMFSQTNLSEIVLPDNITEIDDHAFYNLDGTSENPFHTIIVPEGVSIIRSNAFSNCDNLTTVTLPSSLREIEGYAFQNCKNLNSIDLGDGVQSIGQQAFRNTSSLHNIAFPESLTTLGYQCFFASGLHTLDIPENLTNFETESGYARTFEDCYSLQSVTLPNSMPETPSAIFWDCNNLSSVTLPDNLQSIGSSTFRGCTSLREISLPQSLKNIYQNSFDESGLTSIDIPSSVETISTHAFYRCGSLSEVHLPENLTNIANYTFGDCTALQTITIPESVTNIGEYAFVGSGLTSIVIPNNVKSIGNCCFRDCESLVMVTLSNNLTTLPEHAFGNCGELRSIEITESITTIESSCFTNCQILESIIIPGTVKSIGSYCFRNCGNLADVTFQEGIETIESYAFSGTDLASIIIPESVTSFGSNVFEYCEKLTSIFWNTTTTVPNRLFHQNNNSSNGFVKNPYCLLYLKHANTQVEDTYIKNIIVDGVASEIVLSSEMGNFNVPQEFVANRLIYTRDFTYPTVPGQASGWRSISLPFTVQSITGPNGETLAPFNADVTGAKPFWLRRLTANGFENVTEIEAGVPYIIAMPNNEAYDDEYNISGTVTFTAESGAGITIPATGPENMVQDIGPLFGLNCNYTYHTANTVIWALNESASDSRLAGSVFVRNERAVMPFEGYVATSASSAANAPAFFSIDSSTPRTRSAKPLGPIPSIDDM